MRLVAGYDSLADGHMAAARAVSRGEANCCIATRAAARAFSLDFIPLVHERYDFVIPKKMLREPGVESCLNLLNRASLRRELGTFAGYETTSMGQTVRANGNSVPVAAKRAAQFKRLVYRSWLAVMSQSLYLATGFPAPQPANP